MRIAKFTTVEAFVEYACTVARLEQGEQVLLGVDGSSKEELHSFSNWVANDIIAEEANTIKANGLNIERIRRKACRKAKEWLLQTMREEAELFRKSTFICYGY